MSKGIRCLNDGIKVYSDDSDKDSDKKKFWRRKF